MLKRVSGPDFVALARRSAAPAPRLPANVKLDRALRASFTSTAPHAVNAKLAPPRQSKFTLAAAAGFVTLASRAGAKLTFPALDAGFVTLALATVARLTLTARAPREHGVSGRNPVVKPHCY